MKDVSKIIEGYLKMGHDYGFTAVDDTEHHSTKATLDEAINRLTRVEQLVMPLISNLIKSSDNEYIKWPNREKPLRDLAEKILEQTRFE